MELVQLFDWNRKRRIPMLFISLLFPVCTLAAERHAPPNETREMDPLVRQLTAKFEASDKKGILVMDMQPSFGEPGSFGPWLADHLSAAIARQESVIEVVDRKRLLDALQTEHLKSADEWEVRKAVPLGKSLGATTIVMGSYGAAEKGIGITLVAFRLSEIQSPRFMIGMVFGELPLTAETTAHLGTPLDSLRPGDGVYRSGLGGVSVPTCLKCPVPSMHVPDIDLQGMLRAHPQGATVWLQFVVTEDGHTRNIKVLQPIGFGFDEQYAKAAEGWEFNPAVDAEGKRRPVTFVYHLSFNFK